MLIILPVFIADSLFWQSNDGLLLLKRFMHTIDEWKGGTSVLVVTDNRSILPLAMSFGFEAVETQKTTRDCELIPKGTQDALNQALQKHDPGQTVMVLGFTNPALDHDLLDKAISQQAQFPQAPMVSMTHSTDHLCQGDEYIDLLDIGTIHLFDAHKRTKPFSNNLMQRGNLIQEALTPRENVSNCIPFLVNENENTVSIDFSNVPNIPSNAVGAGWGLEGLVTIKTSDNGFSLAAPNIEGLLSVTVIPCFKDGPAWAKAAEYVHNGSGKTFEFSLPRETLSFLYSIEVLSQENGIFQIKRPLTCDGAPWEFDWAHNRRINRKTGEYIHGRQAFPPMYEPEGNMLITALSTVTNDDTFLAKTRGLVLDERYNHKIESAIDALLWEMVSEATCLTV